MNRAELAERRRRYQRDLATILQHIREALARRPDVERAILFGSYARGRRDLFTDLDILIVMESSLDFVTRTGEMYRYLTGATTEANEGAPVGVDLDLLVYTPEELRKNTERPFIRRVLQEGQVIYEKPTA
jgi:predicted nucleotidyltransferase